MAKKPMYDYLNKASPDNDVLLSTPEPSEIDEYPFRNQEIHPADDGVSEEVVTLDPNVIAYATVRFRRLKEFDAGTVFDYYLSETKGYCMAKSFRWRHSQDHYCYIVKFRSDVRRTLRYTVFQFPQIKFKVLGKLLSLVNATYQWTLSGGGTNEYYCELTGGGNPGLTEPITVWIDDIAATKGTLGSLNAGEWGWGDNDTLGFNTVYVRLTDGSDPDTKPDNYIETD